MVQSHLELGAEDLYRIANDLGSHSSLMQSVYHAILDLKTFKDTRPNTGDYTQYRIDIVPFVERLNTELTKVNAMRISQLAKDKEATRIARHSARVERREAKKIRTATRRAKEKQDRQDAKTVKKAEQAALLVAGKKYCPKCDTVKPTDQFSRNKCRPDGLNMYCWECGKEAYYLPNRDRQIAQAKKWIKTHPDEVREHRRKEKRKPHNRVKANVSKRIKEYLKATSTAGQWREIISCSPQDLVKHLEFQFVGDMSWANYGTLWHIDHIIPCAAFDWSRPSHLIWCWHHRNLRPLLASENVVKADILSNGQTASYLRDCDLETLKKVVGGDLEKLGIASVDEWAASWDAPVEIRYISI